MSNLILDADNLGFLHGKRRDQIYVIMSADGSTVLKDPGLDRPWSSPNKRLAEHHAKNYPGCFACTVEEAIGLIIKHPKNLPGAS